MSFALKLLREIAEKKAQVKTTSADPAWKSAGSKSGVQIWRIENFTVKPWPQEQYGKFYSGDSYIVLNTILSGSSKAYDVHFWLGENTTQDEAGTAAYKTVELDDHLGGIPVQYREVEGYESDRFLNLFPKGVMVLDGGVDSGFNVVKPDTYIPRLLHITGSLKSCSAVEVELSRDSLVGDDVFVLDAGLELFQWNGSTSNGGEKSKGGNIVRELRSERNFKPKEPIILDEGENNDRFNEILDSAKTRSTSRSLNGRKRTGGKDRSRSIHQNANRRTKAIFRLSDATGSLVFTEVAKGKISKDLLKSEDVFIIDTGREVIAWVGSKASANEKKNALIYAETYLQKYNLPHSTPVIREVEAHENEDFKEAF